MHHIQCLQTHQHVWWETTNWQSWLLRMKQKGEATIQWFWEHASKEKPWHVAGVLTAMAQHIGGAYSMLQRPAALIAGGETTVTLTPNSAGKGGQKSKNWLWQRRCNLIIWDYGMLCWHLQEPMVQMDLLTRLVAVVDGGTIRRLPGSAKDALRRHDAYPYLKQVEMGEDLHSPLIMHRTDWDKCGRRVCNISKRTLHYSGIRYRLVLFCPGSILVVANLCFLSGLFFLLFFQVFASDGSHLAPHAIAFYLADQAVDIVTTTSPHDHH
jgi:hypothetical protein